MNCEKNPFRLEETDADLLSYDDDEEIYRSVVATDSGCGEALVGTGPGSFASGSLGRNPAPSSTDAGGSGEFGGRPSDLGKTLDLEVELSSSASGRGGDPDASSECGSPAPSRSREPASPAPHSFL